MILLTYHPQPRETKANQGIESIGNSLIVTEKSLIIRGTENVGEPVNMEFYIIVFSK